MDFPMMKPQIGQRWRYRDRDEGRDFIAEIVNPDIHYSYVKVKIVQVNSGGDHVGEQYNSYNLGDIKRGINNESWTYLPGQDAE